MKRLKSLSPKPRRGFVLVLTLAMILIAVMITGRTANRSLSRTLQSIEAEQLLQRRWEHMSLQRTLLGRASAIFAKHTEPNQSPVIWHDGSFQLSGQSYRVRLSDESAKVNLNQLQRVMTREQFQSVLSSLPAGATHREGELIESWGLLFGSLPASQLIDETTSITCWGDGRLNIHRASEESIRLLLTPVIGTSEADALIRRRNEQRTSGPASLGVPQAAQSLATEQSACHSLWIVDQGREETRLDIRELMDRRSRETSFRW